MIGNAVNIYFENHVDPNKIDYAFNDMIEEVSMAMKTAEHKTADTLANSFFQSFRENIKQYITISKWEDGCRISFNINDFERYGIKLQINGKRVEAKEIPDELTSLFMKRLGV